MVSPFTSSGAKSAFSSVLPTQATATAATAATATAATTSTAAAPHPVIELTDTQKSYLYFHFRWKCVYYSGKFAAAKFIISWITVNQNRLSKTDCDLKEMQAQIDKTQSENLLHLKYSHEKQVKVILKKIPYTASKALPATAAAPVAATVPLKLDSDEQLPSLVSKVFDVMKTHFSLTQTPQVDSKPLLDFVSDFLMEKCEVNSGLNKIITDFKTALKSDSLTPLVIEKLITSLDFRTKSIDSLVCFKGLLAWKTRADHFMIASSAVKGIEDVFTSLIQGLENYKRSLEVFDRAGKQYIWTPSGMKPFASEQVDQLLAFFYKLYGFFVDLNRQVTNQLNCEHISPGNELKGLQKLSKDFKKVLAFLKTL